MSNPLYFVTNCKESMTVSWASPLPMSCGLTKNGDLRMPQNFWKTNPLIFDDSFPVTPTENCLKNLKLICEKGSILDFERPGNHFHWRIIQTMEGWKVSPLWLPEAFAPMSEKALLMCNSSIPHNNWQQFCQSLQRKYPNRWVLEFQPICWEKKLPATAKPQSPQYLEAAVCMCRVTENSVIYYDNLKTLQRKMQIARACGCQGGIALWEEWKDKTMAQP